MQGLINSVEWPLYVFDALVILVAMVCYNTHHFGILLLPWEEQQRAAAKAAAAAAQQGATASLQLSAIATGQVAVPAQAATPSSVVIPVDIGAQPFVAQHPAHARASASAAVTPQAAK